MTALNDPVWDTVPSASNYAKKFLSDIIEGNGDMKENLNLLGEELSHQLTWYEATAYVLPHLAVIFPKLSKDEGVALIAEMGAAIAAQSQWPLEEGTEAYNEFFRGLSALKDRTRELVTDPEVWELLEKDANTSFMFALGALAVIGDMSHSYILWFLSGSTWEEVSAACECGWNDETIYLPDEPHFFKLAEIEEWDRSSLDNEPVWLNGLLNMCEDNPISPCLPYVYGTVICPQCGEEEPYWDFFKRFYEEY